MSVVYTLRKRNSTSEIHIFLADSQTNGNCVSRINAICRKASKAETTIVEKATCLSEQQARAKSAEIGRKVCGTCVSHLYETY